MGFWRFQGLVNVSRPRAVPGHAKSFKNMVLALEFWTPPFHFLMNAPANFAVFDLKLSLGDQVPERLPRWDLGSMVGGRPRGQGPRDPQGPGPSWPLWAQGPRVPLGPGPSWPLGAQAQGFSWGPSP